MAGQVASWIPTLEVEFALCSPYIRAPPSGSWWGAEGTWTLSSVANPNAWGQQGATPSNQPLIAISDSSPVIGGWIAVDDTRSIRIMTDHRQARLQLSAVFDVEVLELINPSINREPGLKAPPNSSKETKAPSICLPRCRSTLVC